MNIIMLSVRRSKEDILEHGQHLSQCVLRKLDAAGSADEHRDLPSHNVLEAHIGPFLISHVGLCSGDLRLQHAPNFLYSKNKMRSEVRK